MAGPSLRAPHLQDGAMFRPFAEIVNTIFPPDSRPEMPVTPVRTVIWPPVGKVGLPASVSKMTLGRMITVDAHTWQPRNRENPVARLISCANEVRL